MQIRELANEAFISQESNIMASECQAIEAVQPLIKDHVAVRKSGINGSVLAHQSLVEDSSSDDDVRAPMDESPPNLSDEESFFIHSHSNSNNHSSNRVISVTRTSSRASTLTHRRGSNNSPPNPLYEAAKPRPPPRAIKTTIKENYIPATDGASEPSQIITVPYMSRGIGKGKWSSANIGRLRRNSRSSSVTSDVDTTVTEPPTSIAAQRIEEVEIRPSANTKPNGVLNFNNNNTKNKNDASPSRQTISSGYSSPGSRSASLSPTSSNASSTSSNALLRHHNLKNMENEKNNNAVKIPEKINEKLSHEDAIKPEEDKQIEEDDIFPVKKWVESSEYKHLNLQSSLQEIKTTQVIKPKQLKIPYVNVEVVSRRRLSHPEKSSIKHLSHKRPISSYKPTSELFVGKNIVSMVENPTSKTINFESKQTNLSTNQHHVGKKRPIYRSRKAVSSRNSRTFAYQARSNVDENELLAPPRVLTEIPDVRRVASLSPKSFSDPPANLMALEKELSASLANLDKVVPQARNYNTVSGATGRHMADKSNFFNDELTPEKDESSYYYSTQSVCTDSMWSLNPSNQSKNMENKFPPSSRKPSFRNRLKGAFSFQNIRKAVSMDKLHKDDKTSERSASSCYLNESGENIEKLPSNQKSATLRPESNSNQPPLQKASSITSIFNTVRMRKRRSRERRNMKARYTIAVDPKQIPEYEEYPKSDLARPKSYQDISNPQEVSSPTHYRPIGRVLGMDVREGSLLVEMTKPPSGPYGFYLARRKETGETGSVYISRLSDSYHDKMFAGLMKLGDEITEINGNIVHNLTLDEVYDIILRSDKLTMRIKPTQVHSV